MGRLTYPPELLELFREWGRKGGKARAKRLTAAERSKSARKAVLSRWQKRKRSG